MRLDKKIHLVKCDCLSLLRTLPDQSIDAIVTDPPYFKVKSASWDNQWKNEDEFFVWLEAIIFELSRVLKRNGSLYLFCSSHLQHRTEGLVNKYFNVLNHILWVKKGGKHNGCDPTSLRRYFPQTESIIFAEHCNALKRNQYVCEEVLQYLKQEWLAAGFTFKDAEKIVGSSARHYFSRSQWHMPSKKKYALLQQEAKPYLAKSYQEMLDLKFKRGKPDQEHMRAFSLVRPMDMLNRPHTNIWNFAPVQYYDGKHPCEKPVKLLEHIILTSSKENDLILDIFAGSCSTAKVALKLNRRFIGCDLDDQYFNFGITSTSKS